MYKSSSSNTATTGSSLPITPPTIHSITSKPHDQRDKSSGYDSDSSDEGGRRPTLPQQGLTLRITNPDTESDTCKSAPTTTDVAMAIVASVTDVCHHHHHHHHQQQQQQQQQHISISNVPDLPPHINLNGPYTTLPHRESKTVAVSMHEPQADYQKEPTSVTDQQMKVLPFQQQQQQQQQQAPCSPSINDIALPTSPKTSTQLATEYAASNASKYAKVSYHLTNDPNAIKIYRDMAEKTNDTTVQLMFAKYLLETANAFFPNASTSAAPVVVGSMWGLGTTTKKVQRPDPFLVVPSITEEEAMNGSSYNSVQSSNKNRASSFDAVTSFRPSIYGDRPSTIATTLFVKQQPQQRDRHGNTKSSKEKAAVDQTRIQKRKALEDEGVKWIKRLAKLNVAEACYMQARWMDKEMYGFKQNKTKSIQLHQVAAKADIPESVFALAEYLQEEGKVEPSRVLRYYKASAEQGYVNAIYKMALITLKGELGTRQSLVQGLKLIYDACKLCSEEFNEPLYTFGLMLTNDEQSQVDVPSELSEAYGGKAAGILYYERAASLNNAKAQAKLGSIYEHGLYGESMNFARAYFHYEVAALNGNPKAMLGLCRLHNRGNHGPGDNNEAFRLDNDVSGWLAATPINEDLSFQWCERAAKAELVDALALLGWFYERGFGTPRDFSRAEKYYRLAAEQGDAGARSRLVQTNHSITKQQHEVINKCITPMPQPKSRKTPDFSNKKGNCYCM
ncbi:uncharacterized protein ATC70_003689 [Mucor velutinosus]|uniref:Uncharacterized protein n=1 Tax=Mucor velutinosus TaxID=708070 RepID=A0AAN7HY63_9FUNG|nr:hypothetical protein ATC70_003689 [Mucor velutinosus]